MLSTAASPADVDAGLKSIEAKLRQLTVPTLIVWGTGDVFFETRAAYWLRDTIPGASEVVEIEGAKLFFPQPCAAPAPALGDAPRGGVSHHGDMDVSFET